MFNISTLLILLVIAAVFAYFRGQRRALQLVGRPRSYLLNSLPSYHGWYSAIWTILPALIVILLWQIFEPGLLRGITLANLPASYEQQNTAELSLVVNDVINTVNGNIAANPSPEIQAAAEQYRALRQISRLALLVVICVLMVLGISLAQRKLSVEFRARTAVEKVLRYLLILCSVIAVLTTVGIVFSVLFESIRFFQKVSAFEFLFGTHWSPQIALRADQEAASGSFGAIPLFVGTLLISAVAMVVAVPTGLMSAIYLAEYADRRVRSVLKPLLEVLAGIPTVVYGFFAALTVAPAVRDAGAAVGLDVSAESALAAGIVMGIMIIPFISSLSDDVINAVPNALRDGAYGLGSTQSEVIRKVIIPAALPGIVGGILLAVSRAIGETMIVVMAAGLAANLTANPLESVTTVTVQIVTLLVGDQEFDSAKTLAAFALGLMLFLTTLILNVFALHIVRKYREQYE